MGVGRENFQIGRGSKKIFRNSKDDSHGHVQFDLIWLVKIRTCVARAIPPALFRCGSVFLCCAIACHVGVVVNDVQAGLLKAEIIQKKFFLVAFARVPPFELIVEVKNDQNKHQQLKAAAAASLQGLVSY